MGASKQIKQAMLEKNITIKQLADLIGVSQQVLSNKLYRDTMSFSDVCIIADRIGFDVKLISKEDKSIII